MPLYLGNSQQLKIVINGYLWDMNIYSTNVIVNGILLVSSDNYILKDTNGLYLTAKEDE